MWPEILFQTKIFLMFGQLMRRPTIWKKNKRPSRFFFPEIRDFFIISFKRWYFLSRSKLVIFVLFWILTFPSYKGLLTPMMLKSDDLSSHVTRLIDFDLAINDGHFPVRWSKRTNFGLGYPFLVFNYPLVYYASEAVLKLGF